MSINRIGNIFSILLIIGLSILTIIPQPVYALTTTLSVDGNSVTYTNGGYVGAPATWVNMNSDDGGTTYHMSSSVGTKTWTFSNPGLPASSVVDSVVITVSANANSTPCDFRLTYYNGSSLYETSVYTDNVGLGSFENYSINWSTNPITGLAWTEAQVNSAEFGYSATDTQQPCVSYIYATIYYTPPSLPTTTTVAATGIEYTGGLHKATLEGTVTHDGGLTIDLYGFVWDTSDKGDPGNNDPSVPPGTWTSGWKSGAGSYGENPFDHQITGLIVNTTYYYRAASHNSLGWSYGSALSFRTLKDPSITTVAASSVASSSARLNSTVTDDGGEDCTITFVYKANAGAHYANYAAVLAAGGTEVTVAGTYSTGEIPYYDISGLAVATNYDYAVKIVNTVSTQYGSVLYFVTESGVYAPTNMKAIPSGTTISLLWTKGVGASTTYIRYKLGSYPTGNADGTLLYNDIEGSYQMTSCTVGTTYYFMAWGYSTPIFSTDNITVMATTLPVSSPTVTINPLPAPTQWWSTSSPTVFSNLPIYGTVNWVFDAYTVPRATGWLIIALALTILGGIAVYGFSHRLLVGVISIGGFMTMFGFMGMIPLWLVFVVVIFIIASVIVGTRL